eukprot:1139138-Pelagomonas_calceolata.AAC.3
MAELNDTHTRQVWELQGARATLNSNRSAKAPRKRKTWTPYCMSSNKDSLHISLASKNLSSTARQRTE